MTKLEKEIYEAISVLVGGADPANQKRSMVAARVAKRYIEKFVDDFERDDLEDSKLRPYYERWAIENGIIFGNGLEESRQNTLLQPTKTVENLVVSNGITSTE